MEITITVPKGTSIKIVHDDGTEVAPAETDSLDDVERYYRDYLSPNARKVYAAAARIELFSGPGYSLADIAANISQTEESVQVETVRSQHRTSGRTAKRWREETGTEAPIQLVGVWNDEDAHYEYRLPQGVAQRLDAVVSELGTYPAA
jgi:hypothetical protein